MALEKFLPQACRYVPCDLARRDDRTVVCDFNAGQFPDAADANIVTVLGVLEYIFDPRAFLKQLRQWQKPIVISYCTTEGLSNTDHRRNLGWVNDFSRREVERLFSDAGFDIQCADRIDGLQYLFRLLPGHVALPKTKRIAVLSYKNIGNFGDRLGYHLINEVLPPTAQVTHLNFRPWQPTEETFDLLIVGIGNSIFRGLADEDLVSLIERSKASIGIFGTQYPNAMRRPMLARILDGLTHWYARFEDDIFQYGCGVNKVSHLGDWLITAFPMTHPTRGEHLVIGDEIKDDRPLDRTIQNIQRFKSVFSTRLHPLLCAMTSAEQVGYREQREIDNVPSGKFRSMLIDVFGRTYPEEQLWPVDRHKVAAYKYKVEQNVRGLRDHILKLAT
jgi:hypothetical protein